MKKEYILELIKNNPESAVLLVKAVIRKYKPSVYDIIKELWGVYKDFASTDEFYDVAAEVKKKKYDAFVKVGFTPEQAMTLMLHDERHMEELVKQIATGIRDTKIGTTT